VDLEQPSPHAAPAAEPVRTRTLDETSLAILEQLRQDGRRSYAAIAKAVGLSEAAVRQRVQRLLDAGVMHVVAIPDPPAVGFPRQAMLGLRIDGDLGGVARTLADIPEVHYAVVTAGRYDLLVEVVCADDAHLLELLDTRIRALPQVRSSETLVYLKLVKQQHHWGLR
jgi:Lrp/AsnC family transcriptional regulator for asnA, asnC and gidA